MAISSNIQTYLTTWSAAFEQFYRPGIGDYLKRFGKTTRAITKNPKRSLFQARFAPQASCISLSSQTAPTPPPSGASERSPSSCRYLLRGVI